MALNEKWHLRFIKMAELVASWSKDRNTKVGSVAVRPDVRIVCSIGYNGMPRGIDDDVESRHQRPEKYLWMEHSERNLIYSASRLGVSLEGCYLYVTHFPCPDCARGIIQSGFSEIYYPIYNTSEWKDFMSRMADLHDKSKMMFSECGIKVTEFFS
jgi:dCMP deaminase